MADKGEVPMDTAKQAVRLSEIEGVLALQAQSVKTAVDNMSSSLSAVQSEVHYISKAIHELALAQARGDKDREAIGRLERGQADLNTRLEGWFADMEAQQAARWSVNDQKNSEQFAKINERVTNLDKAQTYSRGWVYGAGALVTIMLSGFLWVLNDRFNATNLNVQSNEETAKFNRSLIEKERDARHSIELYLARGGYRPNEEEKVP